MLAYLEHLSKVKNTLLLNKIHTKNALYILYSFVKYYSLNIVISKNACSP